MTSNQSHLRQLKTLLRRSLKWRVGFGIISLVMFTRAVGLFSNLELLAIDTFFVYRAEERPDPYITIIGLDTDYLQGQETVSDTQLIELIQTLYIHQPAVVGLNLTREALPSKDRQTLLTLFADHSTLISVEKILPPNPTFPLEGLPEKTAKAQIGFNDQSIDRDGRLRRMFLGLEDSNRQFKKSFSLTICEVYLSTQGYELVNGHIDQDAMRFEKPLKGRQMRQRPVGVEIPRLIPSSGGYTRELGIQGVQTLVNFRAGTRPFEVINASDLVQGTFNPNQIEGRIILIGVTDFLAARQLPTPITSSLFSNGEESFLSGMLGIELEAHAISQIINAVLGRRSLIRPVPIFLEYGVILTCGLCGILIGKITSSTVQNIFWLALFAGLVLGSSYFSLLLLGLWLPVFPATTGLVVVGSTYIAFYQGERESERIAHQQSQALAQTLQQERHRTIERTFGEIHAGPLQTLANILRRVRDGDMPQALLLRELKSLNAEIRRIGEQLRQEGIDNVYLTGNGKTRIDLMHPMHEVFYEVYNITLSRDLPGFRSLKIRLTRFDPFNAEHLNLELKRSLCWFLEEALANVGKHAEGTTQLQVMGLLEGNVYTLLIEDNGPGIRSSRVGEGTRFNYRLQSLLGGDFLRKQKASGGTICRFTWSLLTTSHRKIL